MIGPRAASCCESCQGREAAAISRSWCAPRESPGLNPRAFFCVFAQRSTFLFPGFSFLEFRTATPAQLPKKRNRPPFGRAVSFFRRLFLDGSTNGAAASAGTAGNAGISVDHVLAIALRDSGNGAIRSAGTASDAFVSNFVCHNSNTSINILHHYNAFGRQNQYPATG